MPPIETPILAPMTDSTVYEPAEDSFLLLDALEQDLDSFLSPSRKAEGVFTLEVGCGSGIISIALTKAFLKANVPFPSIFSLDINPEACILTCKNALLNGLTDNRVQPILLEGSTSAMQCFREPFDIIVCNPPYVPVLSNENPEDKEAGLLEKSWSGGGDGNQFITPFLQNVCKILKEDGVVYILLSAWNKPEELCNFAKQHGLRGSMVLARAAGRERLSVWKFTKSNGDCL